MSEIIAPDGIIITSLGFDTPAQRNQSAWTRRVRKTGLPGAETWQASAEIPEIATEADERAWRSFYFGLQGVINWFKLRLPCQRHIGPMPLVAAGGTGGYTQPLKGMTPNTTILFAGQFMTVPVPIGRPRAVMLTADMRTDGGGNATAAFVPALGQIPATDATVETANPFIPVCSTDTVSALNYSNGVSGVSLSLAEDSGP